MRRFLKKLGRDQRGSLMVEALVAVGVFTLLGTAVMTGVSATSVASERMRSNALADTLASNRLTEILADDYIDPPHVFTTTNPEPGYEVTAQVLQYIPGDTFLSKIVVRVYRNSVEVAKMESLRIKGS